MRGPEWTRVFLRQEFDYLGPKLQRLATQYRQVLLRRTRVVTVIGSLGKTTTRRALMAALDCPQRYYGYSNYGASLAANLLRIRPWDRFGVLEAGILGAGWMAGYARMIRPNLVVVTSIASEHNRTFRTLEETREEKVKMLRDLPPEAVALLNGDDENVRWMATQTQARVIYYGQGPVGNDVVAKDVEQREDRMRFNIHMQGQTWTVESQIMGAHMVYPILAAVAAAHLEGLDMPGVLSRLAGVTPATARMEVRTLPRGIQVVNDSYKSGLETIYTALDTIREMPATRKILVLGEVEEPPGKQGDIYRALGERLAGAADVLVLVGARNMKTLRSKVISEGMDRDAVHLLEPDVHQAIALLQQILQPGDLILVKGPSSLRMHRIALALEGKTVTCRVKHCKVKVSSCDACPVLDAPEHKLRNHFVQRYIG